MALPKLDTPTYRLTLPSTGEEIQYRPFLVKEQKLMLVAQDTKDVKESYNNLKEIINVIDEHIDEEIKRLRDRSIILIGFSGGFRRNEIVSLDYEDLDFVEEGLKISLRRSKTDQF